MERNFHIFYAMIAGATPAEKEQLKLLDPNSFHYLNQSGCISDPTINDVEDFATVGTISHACINYNQHTSVTTLYHVDTCEYLTTTTDLLLAH